MEELSQQLIEVSKEGKLEELQSLLENKVNVNYQDELGRTGLVWACYNGHVQCAQLLVEHKADIHLVDNNGYTALIEASTWGRVDCVRLLLECKATVDHADDYGETGFMWASCFNRVDCVKLLLEHRADVDHKANDRRTAMTRRGAYNGNRATRNVIGFLLLCYGADQQEAEAADMELWAEMKTRITAYHTELKKVLSDKVIVDTRLYVEEHGLYHEPLERVMEYCGLDLMLENDPNRNEDDPIPMLLRDRPERVRSAWYWWNLMHPRAKWCVLLQ